MGQICKNAAKVIIYPGPAGEDEVENTGIALMNHLYSHFSDNYDMMFKSNGLLFTWDKRLDLLVRILPAELIEIDEDKYANQGWKWLCQVAFGEWTQRLWMVQRQLLNDELIMMRGPRELTWEIVHYYTVIYGDTHMRTK
jgi:hypothetical protein